MINADGFLWGHHRLRPGGTERRGAASGRGKPRSDIGMSFSRLSDSFSLLGCRPQDISIPPDEKYLRIRGRRLSCGKSRPRPQVRMSTENENLTFGGAVTATCASMMDGRFYLDAHDNNLIKVLMRTTGQVLRRMGKLKNGRGTTSITWNRHSTTTRERCGTRKCRFGVTNVSTNKIFRGGAGVGGSVRVARFWWSN